VALWIGPCLGGVERACLRSAVRHGHPVSLYCYDEPEGVPDGVELRDAASVLPRDSIVRHRSGSVSLFSNWFRYELQRRDAGIWIDCDAYLLAPLASRDGYLVGEFEPGRVNPGVLRLPPESPVLPKLIRLFQEREVPAWLPWKAWLAARWRLLSTGRTEISRMPWGSMGPLALTAMMRRYRLLEAALPPEVLYPARWQDAAWIDDPGICLQDMTTPRTLSVHLWNERIKDFKNTPARPGSFLGRIQEEGRIHSLPVARRR
jgi:hypothetical protein